jgi:hypothetical protein
MPLHSRRQSPNGSTIQQQMKIHRQHIARSRASLPNLAKYQKTHHSLDHIVNCDRGDIVYQRSVKADCYGYIPHKPSSRNRVSIMMYYGTNTAWSPSRNRVPGNYCQESGPSIPRPNMLLGHWRAIPTASKPSHMPTDNRAFQNRRVGEQYIRSTKETNSLPIQAQYQNPPTESSPDNGPRLSLNGILHSPVTKHAIQSCFDAARIYPAASLVSFANRNELGHPHQTRMMKKSEVDSVTVPIPPRTSSRKAARKHFARKLSRPLTRKEHAHRLYQLSSKSLLNTPVSIRTLQQFMPYRPDFRAVGLAVASKEQRRPIHVIPRASRKQIKVPNESSRVAPTRASSKLPIILGQIRHSDLSSEVAVKPISYTAAAEQPTKYIDAKVFTPLETTVKISRQHFSTADSSMAQACRSWV